MRPGARDECRALAHLLMSGPSTARELARELQLSENLAKRVARALSPLVELGEDGRFSICEGLLPVALFAVRERMGIDPLSVLRS